MLQDSLLHYRQEQKKKESEDQQRKQADAVRRLKDQQASASANSKPSLKNVLTPAQEQGMEPLVKVQKQNVNASSKQLATSQLGCLEDAKKPNTVIKGSGSNDDRPVNKQLAKSKSTPSVTLQGQKSAESEKKVKLVRF